MCFKLYDYDGDEQISGKDLFDLYIFLPDPFFSDIFLKDLSLMAAQFLDYFKNSHKNRLKLLENCQEDEELMQLLLKNSISIHYKDFINIFAEKLPAIAEDIIWNLGKFKMPGKENLIELEGKESVEEEKNVEDPQKKEKEIIQLNLLIKNKNLAGKVMEAFKKFSANPKEEAASLYITLHSLEKNFVKFTIYIT